ncbi:MAG: hypothetical protein LBD55_00125 [Treponema sp.]|jgi:hypothetical protein|nr:hypothetical protein [Treponema sp.]
MEVDQETKDAILKDVAPIIGGAVAAMCVAAVAAEVTQLLATNLKQSGLTGDSSIKPTDDETTVSKSEVAASETEGKVAQDKVAASEGEVLANETEARASTGEATAAESGASALRTKEGASDIETKALKMT